MQKTLCQRKEKPQSDRTGVVVDAGLPCYFVKANNPRCTFWNLDSGPLLFISRAIAALSVASGVLPLLSSNTARVFAQQEFCSLAAGLLLGAHVLWRLDRHVWRRWVLLPEWYHGAGVWLFFKLRHRGRFCLPGCFHRRLASLKNSKPLLRKKCKIGKIYFAASTKVSSTAPFR